MEALILQTAPSRYLRVEASLNDPLGENIFIPRGGRLATMPRFRKICLRRQTRCLVAPKVVLVSWKFVSNFSVVPTRLAEGI